MQTETRPASIREELKKSAWGPIAPSFQNRKHLLHNAGAARESFKEHSTGQKKQDHGWPFCTVVLISVAFTNQLSGWKLILALLS